eukprot:g38103.t1
MQVGDKDCGTEENQTWRRNYIRLPERVNESPPQGDHFRYSCVESEDFGGQAAVSATDSLKSVRLTTPSSSSASSSSRVGRQKTAPSSTSASSSSKASPQKKALIRYSAGWLQKRCQSPRH